MDLGANENKESARMNTAQIPLTSPPPGRRMDTSAGIPFARDIARKGNPAANTGTGIDKKERIDMDTRRIIHILIAVAMVFLVVLTGVPYFQYEGGAASISGYVWFPYEHAEFEAYLQTQIADYNINDAVGIPIFIQVFGILGAILLILKGGSILSSIYAVAWGGIGLIGYATSRFLQLGGMYGLHIAVLVAALVLGGVNLVLFFRSQKEKEAETDHAAVPAHQGA